MRRSEQDAALAEILRTVSAHACGAAAQARASLIVGSGVTLPACPAAVVPDLAEACGLARRFSSVLWLLSSDTSGVRAGLACLRASLLLAGGTLLLVAQKRAPALHRLRGLLVGTRAPHGSLEPLCNALVLSGYSAPRVHDGPPGLWVVSAALAPNPDPLDAFFEQPGEAAGR